MIQQTLHAKYCNWKVTGLENLWKMYWKRTQWIIYWYHYMRAQNEKGKGKDGTDNSLSVGLVTK